VPRLTELTIRRLDVRLREPFGIATGAQHVAENLLVELGFDDGTSGIGEAAPFPAVNGETRALAESVLEGARPALLGAELEAWRASAALGQKALARAPSALCAFETALLDAYTRRAGLSLFGFFGGVQPDLETDITLTTGSPEQAFEQSDRARRDGFRTLKVKIGGAPRGHDLTRLRRAHEAFPDATFVLDANASMTGDTAVALLEALGPLRDQVVLFEQPTAADDLGGLATVRRTGVRVAADESVRSLADLSRLARAEAADIVNLKITKSGLVGALDLALAARSHGFGLMIGGMVETRLAMTASACLAGGLGGFSHIDLDTPFFLADDPFESRAGYRPTGPSLPHLDLRDILLGHGVSHATFSSARGLDRAAPGPDENTR
jgi:L-alanine-DL-glutamate epimerase-like enolase superfamily enzyme